MEDNFKMVAKTLFGFEDLLEKELINLGARKIKKGIRNVSFEGDKGFMYKCNIGLRTAIKILKPIHKFKINDEKELYDKIKEIIWEDYLDLTGSLAVGSTLSGGFFTHSQYISLKTKDAIVDRFRDKFGSRPNVDLRHPNLKINIHIDRNLCTVSLDSSGESLHKRGYKSSTNIAPINEVLAAGLVMMSGWSGESNFMDPMCGSGTILIEAAMIACNIPPNLMRNEFGFEKWKDWDVDLYEKIEDSLLSKTRDFHYKISGFDKSPSAVKKAIENVKNANLEEFIKIKHEDFFKTQKGIDNELMIVFNPPYGERLDLDFKSFYSNIGNTFKHKYSGSTAWFITSNIEALKHVGLRPSRKIKLFNAKLESRFVKYDIYQGTRKIHKQKK